MNKLFFYIFPIFVFVSFIFSESELSEDRISKIKSLIEKSKNYAPDFKLNDSNDSLHVLSNLKDALTNFANVYKVNYPLLYGNNKQINEITNLYGGVPAVPWSFLVGVNGEIIDTFPGAILKQYDPVTYSRLEQTIVSELNKINQDSK